MKNFWDFIKDSIFKKIGRYSFASWLMIRVCDANRQSLMISKEISWLLKEEPFLTH